MYAVFNERSLSGVKHTDESKKKASSLLASWKFKTVKSAKQQEKDNTFQLLKGLRTSLAEQDVPVDKLIFHEEYLGNGENGFVHIESQRNELMDEKTRGTYKILFQGDLSKMSNIARLNVGAFLEGRTSDCGKISKRYAAASSVHNNFARDVLFSETSLLATQVATVKGSYAAVIYDSSWERIVVMRDPEGVEPLFWGVPDKGTGLVVTTDRNLAIKACRRFCEFPVGGLFISHNKKFTCGTLNGKEIDDPVRMTCTVPRVKKEEHGRRHTITGGFGSLNKSTRLRRATSMNVGGTRATMGSPGRLSCFPEGSAAAMFALKLKTLAEMQELHKNHPLEKIISGHSLAESGNQTIGIQPSQTLIIPERRNTCFL